MLRDLVLLTTDFDYGQIEFVPTGRILNRPLIATLPLNEMKGQGKPRF